ncbi:flagellar hook assembly protein FlgD [Seleniivibrio woodruffii]|uniref:Basal-body rod modification protein FlgD n=1 Tax=Seleniivibrio woodruffii TaxID=1078050 RepID=A0A4R1K5T6_9BACT|nr:flagellar hook capping FlgD N-terminal domain-containing protein [Seleniivibrio woodruffii]TCK59568.1 flagellar basal-body rod modification protein FlgD [Seleniivibrio woodruffii]TVZ35391.1 flagellar basal-body rod modification protein FlgD [Seleniivibrio woodruffii]
MIVSSASVNTDTYDKSKLKVDNDHGKLNQSDFLNLFITQLQNQDPTEPMDSSQMLQQTSTFSQVESMANMNTNMEKILEVLSNTSSQSQMASASNFIGKAMEYEGNDTTLTTSGAAISFQASQVPTKTSVIIRDASGKYIRTLTPTVTDTDKMFLVWDGTDASGNKLATGSYKFSVKATNADGKEIDVKTYSNGQVTGITTDSGKLTYEVDGKYTVAADKVISVRDLTN